MLSGKNLSLDTGEFTNCDSSLKIYFLLKPLFQHIPASTIHSGLTDNIGLKGFGRSLAGGLDLDNNGFNGTTMFTYFLGFFVSIPAYFLKSK